MKRGAWPYGYGVLRHSVLALTTLVTTLATVLVVGCGADERPPVGEEMVVGNDDAPLVEREKDDRLGPVICEPFARRACIIAYNDEYGRRICQPTFRVCRHDGRRWTTCGDLDGGMPTTASDSEEDARTDDQSDAGPPEDELR